MITINTKTPRKYFLIDLLESFSTSEIERFTHFVASTYFNTDKRVIRLLRALKQNVLGKVPYDDPTQVKVYRRTFSNLPIAVKCLDKKQKKLLGAKMSLLIALAKRFLTIEALEETPACEKELLNKRLLEKKQFRLLAQLHKKNQQYLREKKVKGIAYYKLAYQIGADQSDYLHQKNSLLKKDDFSELIENLDIYYLLNKLELHVQLLALESISQKKYDFTSMKCMTPLLTIPAYATNPLINTYQTVIQLLEEKEATTYFFLLKKLDKYQSVLTTSDLIDFYNVAGNFCIQQIRLGKNNFYKELFELYKKMDNKNLLLEGQFMQSIKLKNLVAIACKNNEFNWATQTVHHYTPFIDKSIQKSVYHFNLGIIDFYQHQYKTAISHLIRVEKVNIAYDLDSRLLLLQAYYLMDTEYDERTMRIFRSTEHYIYMHKTMPTIHKKNYKNFIQILISLYRVRHRVGKTNIETIKNKLSKMETVMAKKWLLDQIAKIK